MYKLGIDCGSTTLKLALLKDNELIYSKYERHNADILETLNVLLQEMIKEFPNIESTVCFTGSAGFKIANDLKVEHAQEVIAATTAIQETYDDVDVCIELGGEDAKVIFFDGLNPEQRMNGACAGGTGAFIDQMASLLNISVTELNEYAKNHDKIYPIASRCGVFAKTDVQPLINQGVSKENISVSILQAVVNQTIAGLAQGKTIKGKICFLGGPLTFLSELRNRFISALNLENPILPSDSAVFMAKGAAMSSFAEPINIEDLLNRVSINQSEKSFSYKKVLPKLFESENDLEEFKNRHAKNKVDVVDINAYSGKAYLGIDCGSTTTKLILMSENNDILYQYYSSNKGQPVDVVSEQIKHIYSILPKDVVIAGAVSTGYGESLVKSAFNLDRGQVETICHYKAARHFMPNVDFIIDIGGQDMKCFKIKNDNISSIILNEACSSGCGSFIETFAHALNYEVKEFAEIGLLSNNPVDLGSKCTVFMNSSVKSAQKEGATPGDISAGLAYSVVKNALYKVIRVNDVKKECGENIIVQGGTFYNNAILRAFEKETKVNVIRPTIAGLMGAFGAALIAKSLNKEKSSILNEEDINKFDYKSRNLNCGKCPNNCLMTLNTFTNGEKHISGNRCEIGAGIKDKTDIPNLYLYKYDKLTSYEGEVENAKGTIALPLVLNMYENLPFFATFFKTMGYNIKISPRSSKELYEKGQGSIASDTVCYPAKLVHGHIHHLMEEDIDYIFYPNMPFNFKEKKHPKNHYNCPVVANYPELINGNIDGLKNFHMPYLSLGDKKVFINRMFDHFKQYLKVSKKEITKAFDKGLEEYYSFKDDLKAQGQVAIKYAENNNKKIIVLAGRPYHIDPEINHGIDKLLRSLDCVVLSEDSINHLEDYTSQKVLNQWTYHTRLYDAAKWATKRKDTNLIQLVSFGCGLDAITTDEVCEILEISNKFYTQLKIDEISNLGAVNIRIRSLLENLEV